MSKDKDEISVVEFWDKKTGEHQIRFEPAELVKLYKAESDKAEHLKKLIDRFYEAAFLYKKPPIAFVGHPEYTDVQTWARYLLQQACVTTGELLTATVKIDIENAKREDSE